VQKINNYMAKWIRTLWENIKYYITQTGLILIMVGTVLIAIIIVLPFILVGLVLIIICIKLLIFLL